MHPFFQRLSQFIPQRYQCLFGSMFCFDGIYGSHNIATYLREPALVNKIRDALSRYRAHGVVWNRNPGLVLFVRIKKLLDRVSRQLSSRPGHAPLELVYRFRE